MAVHYSCLNFRMYRYCKLTTICSYFIPQISEINLVHRKEMLIWWEVCKNADNAYANTISIVKLKGSSGNCNDFASVLLAGQSTQVSVKICTQYRVLIFFKLLISVTRTIFLICFVYLIQVQGTVFHN